MRCQRLPVELRQGGDTRFSPAVGWPRPASLEKKQARECDQSQSSADRSAANVGGEREEELHRDIL